MLTPTRHVILLGTLRDPLRLRHVILLGHLVRCISKPRHSMHDAKYILDIYIYTGYCFDLRRNLCKVAGTVRLSIWFWPHRYPTRPNRPIQSPNKTNQPANHLQATLINLGPALILSAWKIYSTVPNSMAKAKNYSCFVRLSNMVCWDAWLGWDVPG